MNEDNNIDRFFHILVYVFAISMVLFTLIFVWYI
jgi:hypothetical protein